MPRLVLRMCLHGRTIIGWVEHQDKALQNPHGIKDQLCLYDDGQFAVKSSLCPALTGRTLYLRGMDVSQDDVLFVWHYTSVKEAQAAYNAICKAVRAINAVAEPPVPDGDPKFERIV